MGMFGFGNMPNLLNEPWRLKGGMIEFSFVMILGCKIWRNGGPLYNFIQFWYKPHSPFKFGFIST
jgi:hypothetical protein